MEIKAGDTVFGVTEWNGHPMVESTVVSKATAKQIVFDERYRVFGFKSHVDRNTAEKIASESVDKAIMKYIASKMRQKEVLIQRLFEIDGAIKEAESMVTGEVPVVFEERG